ncbi:amino acid adenylation domain-containing protein [Daejeonella sp.]|jgi:amino acid adenylation domain-containing protein|uniref:amino acid adenylation domain-containing protein n=1 Tax=Daejeonella sp. TaxID=2805397 RepID=UPI003782DD0B
MEVKNVQILTPLQEGILFHVLRGKDTYAYFEQYSFLLTGFVDQDIFLKSLSILIERHEALRTRFVPDRSTRPIQLVLEKQIPELVIHDLRNLNSIRQNQIIQEFCEEDKKRYFNLQTDSLFRASLFYLGDQTRIILSFHHIILDGWSFAIVLKELFAIINSLYNGKELHLAQPVSFREMLNWLEKQAPKAAIEFWKHHLNISDDFAITGLPSGFAGQNVQSGQISLHKRFDKDLSKQLAQIASKLQVSINTVVYSIWGIVLARYNQTNKVITGITVSGREIPVENATEIVGMCINTIPFAFHVSDDISISHYIQKTSERFIESIPFQYYSLADIQQQSGITDALFDHIVVIEDYPYDEISPFQGLSEIEISTLDVFEETHYPFSIHISSGEEIYWRLAFKPELYPEVLMQQVLEHITCIAKQLCNGVEENNTLSSLSLLTENISDKILNDFNNTKRLYPEQETIISLYLQRLKKSGEITFLGDNQNRINLIEFEKRTNLIYSSLLDAGVKKGDSVAISGDRSVWLIASIIAILKRGAVYVPIDVSHPAERINYVLADCNAKVMLCYNNPDLPELLNSCKILHLENLRESSSNDYSDNTRVPESGDPAYIIYTSGSTGSPKGVIVTHQAVVNHLNWMQEVHALTPDDCLLQKTPATFDVSVWELFHWIFSGCQTYFLPSGDEKDPIKICDTILNQKITVLHFVPSMLSVFLDEIGEQQLNSIRHLRYVVASGEALPLATVKKFNRLIFESNNTYLLNLYGPTEATVSCTGFMCSPLNENYGYIPIGKPLFNYRIYILDKQKKILPPWIPGELYIAGISLAKGYNNNIQLTDEKFSQDDFVAGERMYRSGDAAMWNDKGEVIYLGRLDEQLKFNGQRIESGEIEASMLHVDGIKETAVLLQNGNNHAVLTGFYTGLKIDSAIIREELLQRLPVYMIPSQLIWVESMPRLTSGKINRKALVSNTISASSSVSYQQIQNDAVQLQLLQIWKDVLGIAINPGKDFFENGGHSISAIRLLAAIRKRYDITVGLPDLFRDSTLLGLAACIKNKNTDKTNELQTAPLQQFYSLMPAQESLYVLQQLPDIGCTYQMAAIIPLKEKPDTLKLLRAIQELINRHAALRTLFHEDKGNVFQELIPAEKAFQLFTNQGGIIQIQTSRKNLPSTWQKSREKIDISTGPLFNAYIVEQEDTISLVLDIHHIISDEHSNNLLAQEIVQLYQGEILSPVSFQYPDVSYWYHHVYLLQEPYKKDSEWWKKQLTDAPGSVELPTPKKRPLQLSFSGAIYEKKLSLELSEWIYQTAKSSSLTPFTVLFTAFQVLLARYSLQDDFLVGIPVTNRSTDELNGVAGLLVNTLPFRCTLDHDRSFTLQMQQTGRQLLEVMDHAWYPLAHILQDQQTVRTKDRHPLFSVLFNYLNSSEEQLYSETISGEEVITESKFDLSIEIKEQAGEFIVSLNYCTELFDRVYIQSFFNNFQTLIDNIRQNENTLLRGLDIVSTDEKNNLIKIGTGKEEQNKYETLQQILEDAYQNYAHFPAIASLEQELNYAQLQQLTYGIGYKISQTIDIQKDTVIAICMKRSILTVAAVHAVILSGAAYLPLDPDLPEERIRFMLEDSAAALLLHQEDLTFATSIRCCKINHSLSALQLDFKKVQAGDLAYIIYTSGSTGKPKGVLVEQGSIVNRLCWLQRNLPASTSDTWLWKTAFTFDVALGELFGWTLGGSRLIILPNGDEKSPEAIIQAVFKYHITRVHFVASMLQIFLEYVQTFGKEKLLISLHNIFTSGEAVSPELIRNFNSILNGKLQKSLLNLYGPTEATVEVTSEISSLEVKDYISIGKPADNVQIYIVHPVTKTIQPLGVSGEIVLGGVQVARGYKNRMVLQHKVFRADPFKPSQRIYYSGDLGCWMADGTIQFKGRADKQVKLNGYRIELQEIEKILEQHPLVQKAVVLIITSALGNKELVAFIQADVENLEQKIIMHLQQFLPAYMIPSGIILMSGFPLSSSGKTNIKELEQVYLLKYSRNTGSLLSNSDTELKLLAIFTEVLDRNISVTDDFFVVGGHSILAIKLMNRIQQRFEISVSLHDIFTYPSVRSLSLLLQTSLISEFKSIPKLPKQLFYSLSPAQRRLWFLQQLQPDNIAYNMTFAFKIQGKCNVEALKQSFNELVNRHDQLRAGFILHDEGAVLEIKNNIDHDSYLSFHYQESSDEKISLQLADEFCNRPFKLDKAPLFRVLTTFSNEEVFYVFLNMHHIITDGWSMGILLAELTQIYQSKIKGEPVVLPSIAVSYTDIAHWLQAQTDEKRSVLTKHWMQRLDKNLESAFLPGLESISNNDNQGKTLHVTLQEETVQQIRITARLWNCSENQLMLFTYAILLANLSQKKDFVFGISVSGRSHPDMENVVGFFVNMLPIIVKTDESQTVKSFFDQFVHSLLTDMNFQDLPFDELVALMQHEKGIKLGDLIKTRFVYNDFSNHVSEIDNALKVEELNIEMQGSKFDLSFTVQPFNNTLTLNAEYKTSKYDEILIAEYIQQWEDLIIRLCQSPQLLLQEFLKNQIPSVKPNDVRQQSYLLLKKMQKPN